MKFLFALCSCFFCFVTCLILFVFFLFFVFFEGTKGYVLKGKNGRMETDAQLTTHFGTRNGKHGWVSERRDTFFFPPLTKVVSVF